MKSNAAEKRATGLNRLCGYLFIFKKMRPVLILLLFVQVLAPDIKAQMRQVYIDLPQSDNHIQKISFYTPSEGYVAFAKWIGYTTDSGRTFTRKYITTGNVDYNGHNVNLTFGFGINGLKAFGKDTLIVYGHYGAVPSILFSTDQGNTFRLVYHSQLNLQTLTGITDMIFPGNTALGYAVAAGRIIKTGDWGESWIEYYEDANSFLDRMEAVHDMVVFAFSETKLVKSSNAGLSWDPLTIPAGGLNYVHFISENQGWLNTKEGKLYYTHNGGASWELKNNPEIAPFYSNKMKFINDSTGYATGGLYTIYKTSDAGVIWEPLPRDNNYTYLGYDHTDLYFLNNNQFWAGGGQGFLELTTNAGGQPIPKVLFRIDTTGLSATKMVNLVNYSKPGYQFKWFKNDTLFSTAYNASYVHATDRKKDTIKLIVSNGYHVDSAIQTQDFYVLPLIASFTPASAATGETVTITGSEFTGATAVEFGGVPAASFVVTDDNTITAVVDSGASGNVSVTTPYGMATVPGFSYIPIPTISSFSPMQGGDGNTITIHGTNLTGATAVSFGGTAARSFTVVSSILINAVVDAGTSGTVAVTTPFGTATKDGFVFMPAPVITSFTPVSATSGVRVTITGTNLGHVNNVQFGGVPAQSFEIYNAATIFAYVGEGATGNVSVSSPYGSASLPGFTFKPRPVITSFTPTSGPMGSTVTISGEYFSNAQKVYFGGVEASSFTIVSDNTIEAVTGPGVDGVISITNDVATGNSRDMFTFQYEPPEITSFSPTTASVGEQITIIGKNFVKGPTYVTFGNTPASNIVVNSSTSITATVGWGTSGDVRVNTPGGEATKQGFTFKQPPPVIDEINPIRATEGMAVQLIGARFTSATAVSFGGVPAASFRVNGDNSITAIVGQGASGTVTVTTPDGTGSKPGFIYGGIQISSIAPSSGAVGTVVTITGSGFVNVSSVLFGKVSASSFTVNSSTSITATVPSGGWGAVTVTTAEGYLASTDEFNYQSPVTMIASVTPSVAGPGATVTINGFGFSQASAVTFGGVPAATYTVNSQNTITATIAGGSSGDVQVTSPLGTGVYSGFTLTTAPVITGFAPEEAMSGSTITISGSNFNTAAAANIVYFGGLKAEVLTASATSLTVKVPVGAPYSFISVSNNGLTGYSQKKFKTLFIADAPLTASSFDARIDSVWGTSPTHVDAADFDLDGRPEVAVCHGSFYIGADHIAIFKNNSTAGSLSFLTKELVPSENGPMRLVTGDLDGDGKLDLIVGDGSDWVPLSVYRNSSSGNTISFDNEMTLLYPGSDANYVACTDVDADGKPDIIATANYTGVAYMYRNTSTTGHLSFEQVGISTFYGARAVTFADMDLDGKPDMVMLGATGNAERSGAIFRNISTPGNIVFEAAQYFHTSPDPRSLAIVDIDDDGRMDLIIPGGNGFNSLSVVRNLSVPGKIIVDRRKDVLVDYAAGALSVGDMNGDGKPDIIVGFNQVPVINIIPNTSSPGNLSFGDKVLLNTLAPVNSICVSDLDSDQRPDIIVSNTEAGSISFFRNNLSGWALTSFSPTNGIAGTVVTIKGENLTHATAVSFGGEPAASFTVVDANTITAVVGAGKSGDVSVTTPAGTATLSGFVYLEPPTITSFTPTNAGEGDTVVIKGTNFTGVSAVSFGGVAASSFTVTSDSTVTAIVGLGATGSISISTPHGLATKAGFTYAPLADPGNVNAAELTAQPNPSHGPLTIHHPASATKATLRFINAMGRTMKTVEPARDATKTTTNVYGLSPGLYTVVWSDGLRTLTRVIAVL
jgi:IPT/TIG domain./FG-GAP repeat.